MSSCILAQNETEVKNKIVSSEDWLFRSRRKMSRCEQISLYTEVCVESQATSVCLRLRCELRISISQTNRIWQEWGLARKRGRPLDSGSQKNLRVCNAPMKVVEIVD
jgi:hypothetical protein